jgi:hypothetical protein
MWSLGMILHKILFFRLPYRHAFDNADDDGNSRVADAEGDKMAELEREVQSYAG